jgi:hypothetical protein
MSNISSVEFFVFFIALMVLTFCAMSFWVMHEFDKDDKKTHKIKTKKA